MTIGSVHKGYNWVKSQFFPLGSGAIQVLPKKDTRRTSPIFRPVTFLVAFGCVLVASRIVWYVIVDVRVTSPSA